MGKKSKPPPAPDYTAAAQATAKSQQQAQTQADYANRATQTTPWGQTSWSNTPTTDPVTGQKVNQWAQNTTLAPQQQQALDSQMALQQGLTGTAQGMLGRVQNAYAQPMDYGQLQPLSAAPQAGGLMAGNLSAGPQLQAGNLDAGRYATAGAGNGVMSGLNTQSLGAMPDSGGDYGRQRVENALFNRLAPQHEQAQNALQTQLSNMGLTRGSEAWNREMQRQGDQQSREMYDAMNTGGIEQQRQFGMQMQGRQQGWNELQGAGQFQNAAQAQGFGQNMAQNAQNFGQQAQAGAQNFGQQAQAGAQNFGQEQAAGNQNFGQQQIAGSQNYNQQLQSAQYANQLRNQQIAEMLQQRQQPINEMNALMTGNQVQNPQFAGYAQSMPAGAVNYSNAANQQYNAAANNANASNQQQQGLMSGIGSLAGMAAMYF